ncbi:hypothetical protein GCM10027089_51780 [Nocardia thraciensis]
MPPHAAISRVGKSAPAAAARRPREIQSMIVHPSGRRPTARTGHGPDKPVNFLQRLRVNAAVIGSANYRSQTMSERGSGAIELPTK